MARLIHHGTFAALPAPRPIDLGRIWLLLTQLAVLGAIGLVLTIAIVNTILGAPGAEPAYTPY